MKIRDFAYSKRYKFKGIITLIEEDWFILSDKKESINIGGTVLLQDRQIWCYTKKEDVEVLIKAI